MKKEIKKEILEALNYDALSEAEKLTGKSYKECKITESIGFFDFILSNKRKEQLLSSVNDTTFHETEESYMKKVTDFGFKLVLTIPFMNDSNIEERFHIMFHDEYSILLKWDTHTWGDDGSWAKAGKEVPPPSRNGGSFFYNWSPNKLGLMCTSSGGFISNGDKGDYSCLFNKDFTPHILPDELRKKRPILDNNYEDFLEKKKIWNKEVEEYLSKNNTVYIWSGDHDCREALKFNIERLLENGIFLKKWKKQPFLWLLHYMDSKTPGYNHEQITKDRIALLPEYIQEIIKGE